MNDYVLITGASQGIGRAFADLVARKKRNLILVARSGDVLEEMATSYRNDHGIDVVVLTADLSDLAATEAMWAEASEGRRIETLVNNAGLGGAGRFDEADLWAREYASMEVNMTALTRLMKLAIPHMKAGGERARILNVASTAAFQPDPGMAIYGATKAYVLSLSEAVATELQNTKITVTALCPGATQSNFFSAADMHDLNVAKLGKLPSAASVAEAGWQGAVTGQRVVIPGAMNKATAFLPRILPRSVLAAIAARLMMREADRK